MDGSIRVVKWPGVVQGEQVVQVASVVRIVSPDDIAFRIYMAFVV